MIASDLVVRAQNGATEQYGDVGEYRVRLRQDLIRVPHQHNQIQFEMAILPDKEISLLLPIFRVINGIQVLPVEFDLEPRICVQRRYNLVVHNHRTRMGRSENTDHENVFSDLSAGRGCEIDKHESGQNNKRASDKSPEEAR